MVCCAIWYMFHLCFDDSPYKQYTVDNDQVDASRPSQNPPKAWSQSSSSQRSSQQPGEKSSTDSNTNASRRGQQQQQQQQQQQPRLETSLGMELVTMQPVPIMESMDMALASSPSTLTSPTSTVASPTSPSTLSPSSAVRPAGPEGTPAARNSLEITPAPRSVRFY